MLLEGLMLLKLFFWMLAFYAIGSWLARMIRGGKASTQDSDNEVGGPSGHTPPPYNPDDVVDAKFHKIHPDGDAKETGEADDGE